MIKPKSISREKPPYRSMDYAGLFREGIERIQQHSGAVWTDYNAHDPGITILENLCFGITDIAYRCNFPVSDLIYARGNPPADPAVDTFFPPEDILPSAAVTTEDYRRLLVDRIPEVENVWIEPVTNQQEGFKGLYVFMVQINEEFQTGHSEPDALDPTSRILKEFAANRNLCEDVEDVFILEKRHLTVEATIHLENDGSAEQVLADIRHELLHFLQPRVVFHRVEDALEAGVSINQIYDGPRLNNGFIQSAELQQKPKVIYRSQIRDLLANIEGVRATEDLRISLDSLTQFREEITIPDNAYLALHPAMMKREKFQERRPIRFLRNGRVVEPNLAIAEQILNNHIALESQAGSRIPSGSAARQKSDISKEAIATYYSIQRLFPAVYGINNYGLPSNADFLRQAQAHQLKGYLAICETFLSSYLKQLSRIRDLFSVSPEISKEPENTQGSRLPEEPKDLDPAYYTEFPHDIPDFDQLLDLNQREVPAGTMIMLDQAFNLRHMALQRKNEFLDHLLARFGETLRPELLNRTTAEHKNLHEVYLDNIRIKSRILREYAALSRDRTRAFNYRDQRTDGSNISTLQRKLYYWLNLDPVTDHPLAIRPEFTDMDLSGPEASGQEEKRAGIPLGDLLTTLGKPETFLIDQQPHGEEQKWTVSLPVNQKSFVLFRKDSETEARAVLDNFLRELRTFSQQCKGFHLIEHILLRPVRKPGYSLVVQIPLGTGEINFVSTRFRSRISQERIAENLLMTAAEPVNYVLVGSRLVLLEDGNPILISAETYVNGEETIQSVVNQVRRTMNEAPGDLKNWIEMEKEPIVKSGLEFYAHRMSIVLPNWPDEFHTPDFQLLFENLVAQQVPPHLQVNFHWLSWKKMAAFEEKYFSWLEARQQLETNPVLHDKLAMDLALLLRDEKSEPAKPDAKAGLILPDPALHPELFKQFGYAAFFDPSDLQIIAEVDQSLENALQRMGYASWNRLAAANNDTDEQVRIKQGLRARGFSEKTTNNIVSWIIQAILAVEGNWEGLIKYQNNTYGYLKPKLQRLLDTRFPDVASEKGSNP